MIYDYYFYGFIFDISYVTIAYAGRVRRIYEYNS